MVTKKKKPTPKTSTKKTTRKTTKKVASRRRTAMSSQDGHVCGLLDYQNGSTLAIQMNPDECEGVVVKIRNNGQEIQCFWDGTQWVCNADEILRPV